VSPYVLVVFFLSSDFELFETFLANSLESLRISRGILHLCLAAEPVQEGLVGNETIFILLVGQLLKHLGGIFLGDLITKIAEEVLELGQHHGAVLVLVVELAELNEVVVVAGVLGLLEGLLDEGDDLIELAELLAGVVGLAVLDADLLDDVEAEGVEDVHEVVHVEDTLHVPVVDLADLFDVIGASRHVD